MRTFLFSAVLALTGVAGAQAQTTCQNYDAQRICVGSAPRDQGTVSQRRGAQMAPLETQANNAAAIHANRRTTTFSDGSTAMSQQYGNATATTFSDGGTAVSQKFGNTTVTTFSDGRTISCQTVYGQQICN